MLDGDGDQRAYSCFGSLMICMSCPFDHLAMAQHHDVVGHLGHDGKIVGDVEGRHMRVRIASLIAASTSICVVTSSAVVGSSKTIRSGLGQSAIAVMARCSWPPETWCG
jgi:hypothetical protein